MSSILLCLCCHATCRATLLGNLVTQLAGQEGFFTSGTTKSGGVNHFGAPRETGSVLCPTAPGTVSEKTSDTVFRANL